MEDKNTVTLVARPSPVRIDRTIETVPFGMTVAEMVLHVFPPDLARFAQVQLNGEYVPITYWCGLRPKPGTLVNICAVPQKGGGGKNPLGTVLSLALMVAAPGLGQALALSTGLASATSAGIISWSVGGISGLSIATGIVSVVGRLVIGAIAPPSQPRAATLASNPAEKPTQFISGARNQMLKFGAVPRVLGKHRMMPFFAARPFTETLGGDQYVRMLFCWGYGPLVISDLKIGETPLEEFEDVEVETVTDYDGENPLSLFSQTVLQTDLSVLLSEEGGWQLRTTDTAADEISIDITFQRGLAVYAADGSRTQRTVDFEIEYSPAGENDWTAIEGGITATAKTGTALRIGKRWTVATGQYDVRIRRTTEDSASDRTLDEAHWTALRTIRDEMPVNMTGIALTAIRIRATDQLNGIVDQLSGVVSSVLPDWDGENWVTRETANPASCLLEVLQGKANAQALLDTRIDWNRLQDWHDNCATAGRECNLVVDTQRGLFDVLRDVAATGRASPANIDGKWSVVEDRPQTVPVQHFTPRNSWDFAGERDFPELPHGFRIGFVNREAGWQWDERIVYADGYDEENATKFEQLDLVGVTDPDQVWKDGRYHLAVAKLRPETFIFKTDIENLVCTRGDLVRLTHDVALIGLGSARVREIIYDDPETPTAIVSVRLDENIIMEAGKEYGLRFRLASGQSLSENVDTAAGETDTLTFSTPSTAAIAVGDLAVFGERTFESIEVLVKEITALSDHGAQLTCIPAAQAVHDADQGEIPEYESSVTIPPDMQRPPTPVLAQFQGDEEALVRGPEGSLIVAAVITLVPPQFSLPLTTIVSWREVGETQFSAPMRFDSGNVLEIAGLEEGKYYDFRVVYKTTFGFSSAPLELDGLFVSGKTSPPSNVTGFSATQNGNVVLFRWNQVPDRDLAGYILRYHSPAVVAQGGDWDTATFLKKAERGDELTTAALPPGDWVVYIKAIDTSGNESEVATQTVTVKNQFSEIDALPAHPRWEGTFTDCFIHHLTNRIVPVDQQTADGDNFDVFDQYAVDPVAAFFFEPAEYNFGFEAPAVRIWSEITAGKGPNQPAPQTFTAGMDIDVKSASGSYDGFEPWTIGVKQDVQFVKYRLRGDNENGAGWISAFTAKLDSEERTETGTAVIEMGGTTVNFEEPFFIPPFVTATATGATALIPIIGEITATGFAVTVFDTGNNDVGGTINWTATGV